MSRHTDFLRKRAVHVALGLVVTIACLVAAVWGVPLEEVTEAFAGADYRTLPLIWACLFLFYWIKAWRWKLLLSPLGSYSTAQVASPLMVGFAFNNLLPAHLGEFVRVLAFSRSHESSRTAVLTTVVLERLFDVVAILLYLGLGLALVEGLDPQLERMAWAITAVVVLGLIIAAVYLIWSDTFVRVTEAVLRRSPMPESLQRRLFGIMETGATGLHSLRNPAAVFWVVVTSIGHWSLNGAMIWLSLRSFDLPATPLIACIVLGVVAFGVTVPSSPGYFGVIQICFWSVLQIWTDRKGDVFAASVYYHLSQYVPVTLVGLLCFARTGLKVDEVEREMDETELPD